MLPSRAVAAESGFDLKNPRSQSQPFTRGIMGFDDYNYSAYNEMILQENPKNRSAVVEEIESRLLCKEAGIIAKRK